MAQKQKPKPKPKDPLLNELSMLIDDIGKCPGSQSPTQEFRNALNSGFRDKRPWWISVPASAPMKLHVRLKKLGKLLKNAGYGIEFMDSKLSGETRMYISSGERGPSRVRVLKAMDEFFWLMDAPASFRNPFMNDVLSGPAKDRLLRITEQGTEDDHAKMKELNKVLNEEGYRTHYFPGISSKGGSHSILVIDAREPAESPSEKEQKISGETVPSPAKGSAEAPRQKGWKARVSKALDEYIHAIGAKPSDYKDIREDLLSGLEDGRDWKLDAFSEEPKRHHKALEKLNDALREEGYVTDYWGWDGATSTLIIKPINAEESTPGKETMNFREDGVESALEAIPSKAICKVGTKAADYSEDAWYRASVHTSKSGGKFAELRRLLGEVEFANENVRQKKFDSFFKLYSDRAFSREFLKKYALLQKKLQELQAPKRRTRQEQRKLSLEIRALEADVAGYSRWFARMHAYAGKNKEKQEMLEEATTGIWAKNHDSLLESSPSEVGLLTKLRRLALDDKQVGGIYTYLRNNLDPECEAAATIELGTGKEAERDAIALGTLLRSYPQLNLNVYTVRTVDYVSGGKPAWRVELGADWASNKKREEAAK
ncbi:hypothetical protein JW721_02500 [Candidatus Micrarchaeota archaeon]|nr:hypothetical protein [Candidatus Micrarchaeota archaeon]